MFENYLKLAWRNLLKNRGTSFINIIGLSIGMSVAMMIGLWVHDELSFNKYHQNYDRLAQIWMSQTFNGETRSYPSIAQPLGEALRTNYPEDFEKVALGSWNFEHALVRGDKKLLKRGMAVEPLLPEMFTLNMLKGNYADALVEPNSILLSASVAKALFGQEDPLNQTVRFDQLADLKVTGVYEDLPANSDFKDVTFYVTWELFKDLQPWVESSVDNWGNHSFQLFAQLSDNADMEAVSAKIRDIEKPHNENGNPVIFIHPMSRWHLYGDFKDGKNVGGRIQFVWLFGIIGVFVLLLACINFMNLSTARSEKRAKEVGIRKTVGSRRTQLIGQFLSESLLVVFLALIISITLMSMALPWFNELADKQIQTPWLSPVFWMLTLGFTLITGLLAGSYPAFYLSSFKPLKVLKGTFSSGRSATLPRKILVVTQFTISIALIIGTLVVFRQIQFAKNRPVGYDREGLLQLNMNTEFYGHFDLLRNDLLRTGTVEEVSQSSGPVTAIWSNQIGFNWEGKDPESQPSFAILACSHEFGQTVDWNILKGRDFSRDYSTDTLSLLLNEAAVELIGMDDIVGKTINWNDEDYQVIGVVENLIMESPYAPIRPTIFTLDYDWVSFINVELKEGIPMQQALAEVETVFSQLAPNSPFEYTFTDENYEAKFRAEERIGKLARIFAILAIFISCLGLLGLSAYVAEQRTKEIGIRKVLGATVLNLWALQSKSFLTLVIISCLLATPLAWYFLQNWLTKYEYHIELQWWFFALAGGLAVVITLFTVSFQAIKAALNNPVESLRNE